MEFMKKEEMVRLCMAVAVIISAYISVTECRANVCDRWNCPCLGSQPRHHLTKRFDLEERAHNARDLTRRLLEAMEEQRFGGNRMHIRSLRNCIDEREPRCLQRHLIRDCTLESLPAVERMDSEDFPTDADSVTEFTQTSRNLLGRLAVHMEQARQDEEAHHGTSGLSLADEIGVIEEEGIYRILCDLQIDFNRRRIPWVTALTRELMMSDCRSTEDRARVDNRNYMVFYILEKLLHNFGGQMGRVAKRDVEAVQELQEVQEPII